MHRVGAISELTYWNGAAALAALGVVLAQARSLILED
jgi:hypothetical protein